MSQKYEEIVEELDLNNNDEITSINQIYMPISFKIVLVVFMTIIFILIRILYTNQMYHPCLVDTIHRNSFTINRLIQAYYREILGIGQVLMDISVIFISLLWIGFIGNSRIAGSILTFFSIRYAFLNIQKFPFPIFMVWKSPGFYSLTVPYSHTRDFFYSGHTGTTFLIFLQLWEISMPSWLQSISFLIFFYMIVILVVTRVHYTIDVIAAIIFAKFIHSLVGKYLYYYDWIFSLPYKIFFELRSYCFKNNQSEQ